MADSTTTHMPPRPGWFRRNWKWVVPVGCLLPVLACGGFITLIFAVITGAIRSSEPYGYAVAQAKQNQELIAVIGSPIEVGTFASGSIEVENQSGDADLRIPVAGPKGSGTVHVVANKDEGVWSITTLDAEIAGSTQRIDLLPPGTKGLPIPSTPVAPAPPQNGNSKP